MFGPAFCTANLKKIGLPPIGFRHKVGAQEEPLLIKPDRSEHEVQRSKANGGTTAAMKYCSFLSKT